MVTVSAALNFRESAGNAANLASRSRTASEASSPRFAAKADAPPARRVPPAPYAARRMNSLRFMGPSSRQAIARRLPIRLDAALHLAVITWHELSRAVTSAPVRHTSPGSPPL